MVTPVDFDLLVSPGVRFKTWRNTEECNELWSDRLRLFGSILGKWSWYQFTGGHDAEHLLRISLRDAMPVSSASETSPSQNSPLLHFSGESLWLRLTGTVINSVKAALRYLLYLKVVFIDWNFPELIWPSVKFTIHTTSTPVNEGKYDRTCWL